MVTRSVRLGLIALAVTVLLSLTGHVAQQARAEMPLGNGAQLSATPQQGLLHKTDTFRTCQEIYWCGVRRDGRPRCGPSLRCRTCTFVRVCRRSTGCVWEEKCKWGPYVPPVQQ